MVLLAKIIGGIVYLFTILIVIRAILSFFPYVNRVHPIIRFLDQVTEPLLQPFRMILPTSSIGIDFSPLIAIFVLQTIGQLLISFLLKIGY